MDLGYKYADLSKEKIDVIDKISRLETEISQKTGQDIVLIAYTNSDKKQ